jgi:hypothetical protein
VAERDDLSAMGDAQRTPIKLGQQFQIRLNNRHKHNHVIINTPSRVRTWYAGRKVARPKSSSHRRKTSVTSLNTSLHFCLAPFPAFSLLFYFVTRSFSLVYNTSRITFQDLNDFVEQSHY